MNARAVLLVAALTAAGASCNPQRADDVPALVTEPTAASRAELVRVVSSALGGVPVTLADDALTASSVLTIERRAPGGLDAPPLTGRSLEMPERFRLVLSGARCVLVHESGDARSELVETTCRPEQPEQPE